MDEPIEEVYFNWLYHKVASITVPSTPSLTYYTLIRDLHSTEFVWIVEGDDNRAEDGLEVRKEFLREIQLDQDPPWLSIPCSVLEMLIAFSRRTAFQTDTNPREWFWTFLDNLGLSEMTDARANVTEKVYRALERMLWRTYRPNGKGGGLFPLDNPQHDQTKVEIWYQFCEYLVEQEQKQLQC